MKIKDVFKSLNQSQRDCLMSAFDKGEFCILELGEGRFICCNYKDLSSYNVEDTSEFWCVGTFKQEK